MKAFRFYRSTISCRYDVRLKNLSAVRVLVSETRVLVVVFAPLVVNFQYLFSYGIFVDSDNGSYEKRVRVFLRGSK